MLKQLLFIIGLLTSSVANAELAAPLPAQTEVNTQQADSNTVIHDELRAILTGIENAINTEKYVDLKTFFSKDLRVTTVSQEIINTHAGIDAFFNEKFGKGGYLKTLKIKLNPDELTHLYDDANNPTWGLVYGAGTENYQLSDGRFLPLKTRWTATLKKESDGKWRILALHIGTNFFDNPIYNEMKQKLTYMAIVALILGLILGPIIMRLAGYRKVKT